MYCGIFYLTSEDRLVVLDEAGGPFNDKTVPAMLADSFFVAPIVEAMASTPVNNATVSAPDTPKEIIAYLTPASGLTALEFLLPSNASSRIGQRVLICCSKEVETLGVHGKGTETVHNWEGLLSAGDLVVFIKVADNVWSRAV